MSRSIATFRIDAHSVHRCSDCLQYIAVGGWRGGTGVEGRGVCVCGGGGGDRRGKKEKLTVVTFSVNVKNSTWASSLVVLPQFCGFPRFAFVILDSILTDSDTLEVSGLQPMQTPTTGIRAGSVIVRRTRDRKVVGSIPGRNGG